VSTHLSRFFRQRREACAIGLGELACRCGYRNISKGANRIQRFEATGEIAPTLFIKLASALDITPFEIDGCLDQDRAEWKRRARQPIEPHLVIRYLPAVYARHAIPADLHTDRIGMESFAAANAAAKRKQVALVLSRIKRIWFDQDGIFAGITEDTFEKSFGPYLKIGGRHFLFNLPPGELDAPAHNE
jgi:hypothetical protein